MATMVFGALGASLGGSLLGGAIGAAVGRMVGAQIGRHIDERLFGSPGEESVVSHTNNLRITTVREGTPITEVYGRNRVSGHMIWFGGFSSKFIDDQEHVIVSFALGLCEGEIHRVGRIWVGTQEVHFRPDEYRLHRGNLSQEIDQLLAKKEGQSASPAYNGFAYLVFEDLDLFNFGNQIPNFEFEVFRHTKQASDETHKFVEAVAIIPGSGDYVYATKPVTIDHGFGAKNVANMARQNGETDFCNSISDLRQDLPKVKSTSLVVSWFGDDLRASKCQITPRVEQSLADGDLAWLVSGVKRQFAATPSYVGGRPVYGGTPSDDSVVQGITHLRSQNLEVMFYPFILMDIPNSNQLPDPEGADQQPVNPWRGRITTDVAEGKANSEWGSSEAEKAVESFLGNAQISDFSISDGKVEYTGPTDWGYRRFILHYMHLCKLAGGVDEFLIGSELVGLTSIKSSRLSFPFVSALKLLAKEAKQVLGDGCKIGYAADWSEYFGCAPKSESNALYFHLDSLWSDENIDFIGIDNYMPMSDWREDSEHLDEAFDAIYNPAYLKANIMGAEGFDWYYKSEVHREKQIRTPITDSESEPWVWRYKDIENWWSRVHYDRPGGVRSQKPTSWIPRSKPIYFTEYGTAALNSSTNQPNKFIDPKSSESQLAYFSDGSPDSYIQNCYVEAFNKFWGDENNNPPSDVYHGQMVNATKSFYWCWDARPWPEFPGRVDLWSDGENYRSGHWLNGRANMVRLSNIVKEVCAPLGAGKIDVNKLYGHAIGVSFKGNETIRQKLEFLMSAFLFDAYLKNDKLHFVSSGYSRSNPLNENLLVTGSNDELLVKKHDYSQSTPSVVEIDYIGADKAYEATSTSLNIGWNETTCVNRLQLPCVLDDHSVRGLAENYFEVVEKSKYGLSFTTAIEGTALQVGDVFHFPKNKQEKYLVQKIIESDVQKIQARVLSLVRAPKGSGISKIDAPRNTVFRPWVEFIDMPFGDDSKYQIYTHASPWVGNVAIRHWNDTLEYDRLLGQVNKPSMMGKSVDILDLRMANRRQNGNLMIEFANEDLNPKIITEFGFYVLAIGADSEREFVGFESYVKHNEGKVELRNFYRGLAGTKTKAHPPNTPVIILEPETHSASSKLWDKSDQVNFFYAPIADEENFGASLLLERPIEASRPLSPCRVKRTGNELTFIPRYKQDRDLWTEEIRDKLTHIYEVYKDDRLVASGSTNEGRIILPQSEVNETLSVHIHSVDQAGRASHSLKETIL